MTRLTKRTLLSFVLSGMLLASCNTIDLYEKSVPVPGNQWKSSFRPAFSFDIKDTASGYAIYLILRHTDKYNFNNLWVNFSIQAPGDTVRRQSYEVPLANKEGWLGVAMNDVYEHRINLTPDYASFEGGQYRHNYFHFPRPGNYTFTLEQIMREDPLLEVLDVGVRIEKKP